VVDLRQVRQAALAARAPQAPFDPALGVLSPALLEAVRGRLARREQVLLLLNRRGYATSVQCHACGDVASCPHCSIALTYHRVPEGLVCHYCQHQAPLPARCPRCGEAALRRQGLGTQQVERLVAERFPEARLARMDVDTTSGKWAHARILDRVAAGEVDILLGTQMIAKGLDFPNVTLVGVVDADTGLNLPDFRAAERTFQLLSQVAGRAGRGPKGGTVIIQTRLPECHDYRGFVQEEWAARRAPVYPPYVSLLNAVCSASEAEAAAAAAGAVAAWLRARLAARQLTDVVVVGPAPCPVERIKDRWRWHFLVKGARPAVVSHVARLVAEEGPTVAGDAVRLVVDRDPVSLL
jgi:primosomal protein N' (replication factor Y)